MSNRNRRLGVGLVVTCIAGGLLGGGVLHNLGETLVRLAITAGCAIAVVVWVRPSAESDMICKAEITGYLDGVAHRADVIPLDERRHCNEVGRRDDSPGPRSIPEQG